MCLKLSYVLSMHSFHEQSNVLCIFTPVKCTHPMAKLERKDLIIEGKHSERCWYIHLKAYGRMEPFHLGGGGGGTHISCSSCPNHESMPESPPALTISMSWGRGGGGGGVWQIHHILPEYCRNIAHTFFAGGGGGGGIVHFVVVVAARHQIVCSSIPYGDSYGVHTNAFRAFVMPIVHIWLAMGIRSPYLARIPLSVRGPPRGLPAEAGGGCEIFVRIHGLPRPLRFEEFHRKTA